MNIRKFHDPIEPVQAAIRAMAAAVGADPEAALADAIPFQYVVRAVSIAG